MPRVCARCAAVLAATLIGCGSQDPDLWDGGIPTVGVDAVPPACARIDPEVGYVDADSAGVSIVINSAPAWSDAERLRLAPQPSATIGGLGAPDNQQFADVTHLARLDDGRIVIADGQTRFVSVYDGKGAFLNRFGGRGGGPGEFAALLSMTVGGGDTLRILSVDRYTSVTADGEVVSIRPYVDVSEMIATIPDAEPIVARGARPTIWGAFDDGSILATLRINQHRPDGVTAVFRDTLLAFRLAMRDGIAEKMATVLGHSDFEYWPGDGSVTFGEEPFGTVLALAATRDRIYIGAGDRYLIDERLADGSLVRRIVVCDEPEPVTDERYDAYVAALLDGMNEAALPYEERAYANIPRRPVAAAHAELFVDAVDRLWVRNLTMPGGPTVWRLIDPRGRWLGDITVPTELEVVGAGRDWVLGRATDDLDVESARLYPLLSGSR